MFTLSQTSNTFDFFFGYNRFSYQQLISFKHKSNSAFLVSSSYFFDTRSDKRLIISTDSRRLMWKLKMKEKLKIVESKKLSKY